MVVASVTIPFMLTPLFRTFPGNLTPPLVDVRE